MATAHYGTSAGNSRSTRGVGTWANAATAVTQVDIVASTGSWAIDSRVTLYGLGDLT